jgi:hypothetical protein
MLLLQIFHPGRNVERPNGREREPAIFAPGEKPAAGARIGPPRVIVVDVGGEEFDVAPVGLVAEVTISAGTTIEVSALSCVMCQGKGRGLMRQIMWPEFLHHKWPHAGVGHSAKDPADLWRI